MGKGKGLTKAVAPSLPKNVQSLFVPGRLQFLPSESCVPLVPRAPRDAIEDVHVAGNVGAGSFDTESSDAGGPASVLAWRHRKDSQLGTKVVVSPHLVETPRQHTTYD